MIQLVRDGGVADAALVAAALAGEAGAFASLFESWFDRCFEVAYRIVRNRDVAAEVAQEVFLAAWRDLATLRDQEAFGGWVLRASRNRALNRLEKERRTVALGDEATTAAVDAAAAAPDAAADALSGTGADLVWAACAALGERDASILDLHLRHGMAAPELAETLGVTANNAHQLLFRLRVRLGEAIRGFVLWHDGRPACPELQVVLHRAGLGDFGPEAAKAAQRHAQGCERCGERLRLALAPEALFAGVPLVLAGPQLRARVISALSDEGVPVGGDPAAAPPALPEPPEATALQEAVVAEAPPGGDAEERRRRRRGVLLAVVLALLLLVGGVLLSTRQDPPERLVDAPVLAIVVSLPSTITEPGTTTTGPTIVTPATSVEVAPSPTTAPPLTVTTARPITATTAAVTTTTGKPPASTSTTRPIATTTVPPLRPPVIA